MCSNGYSLLDELKEEIKNLKCKIVDLETVNDKQRVEIYDLRRILQQERERFVKHILPKMTKDGHELLVNKELLNAANKRIQELEEAMKQWRQVFLDQMRNRTNDRLQQLHEMMVEQCLNQMKRDAMIPKDDGNK